MGSPDLRKVHFDPKLSELNAGIDIPHLTMWCRHSPRQTFFPPRKTVDSLLPESNSAALEMSNSAFLHDSSELEAVPFAQFPSRPLQHNFMSSWDRSVQSLERSIHLTLKNPALEGNSFLSLSSHCLEDSNKRN